MISLTVLMGVHFVSADSSSLIHIFFCLASVDIWQLRFPIVFPSLKIGMHDANLWPSVILHFEIELLFGLISPLFGVIRPRSFPFLRASPKEKCESQNGGIWGHGAYTSENTFSQIFAQLWTKSHFFLDHEARFPCTPKLAKHDQSLSGMYGKWILYTGKPWQTAIWKNTEQLCGISF